MREEIVRGIDGEGREVFVRRLTPETPEDVDELRRRAKSGEIDDRESFADDRSKPRRKRWKPRRKR